MKISDVSRDAFISVGLLRYTAKIIVFLSINRFIASLVLLVFFETPTIFAWSILYCLATFATAIIGFVLTVKVINYPQFELARVGRELRQGFAFSVGVSARNIYDDLDKSMLAKLSTVQAAGIYGAAYQILSVSLIPVQSIMLASFKDFFKKGAAGIRSSFNLSKKLILISFAYSFVAILCLFLFGPLLPKILGDSYADSVVALMWLSPVIILRAVHFFAADVLTGANYQSSRSVSQVTIAFLNGILNFWLIPLYGWHGAIWATIASEFILMILLWGFVYRYSLKEASVTAHE